MEILFEITPLRAMMREFRQVGKSDKMKECNEAKGDNISIEEGWITPKKTFIQSRKKEIENAMTEKQ